MPIDVNVPQPQQAQIQYPQTEDPLQTMGRIQTLRNMKQESVLHGEELKAAQMRNQATQLDLNDNQVMRDNLPKALADPANRDATGAVDYRKVVGSFNGKISPKTAFALIKQGDDANHTQAQISTLRATADKDNQAIKQQQVDHVAKALNTVAANGHRDLDFSTALTLLKSVHPEDAAYVDGLIAQAKQFGVKSVTDAVLSGISREQETANAAQTRANAAQGEFDIKKDQAPAALEKIKADAAKAGADSQQAQRAALSAQLSNTADPETYDKLRDASPFAAQFPPSRKVFDPNGQRLPGADATVRNVGLTSEQRTQADQAAANAAETKGYHATEAGLGQARLGIEQKQLGLAQQRYGFETSGGVSPAAQLAAEGKMSPQLLRSMMRSNPGIIAQIKQVDPNFDEANIDKRFGVLKEFNTTTPNKAGGQVLALNTVIHHADLWMQTAEALKNGTFRPGNKVYNAVADAFGSAPPTNANLVARFFAGEIGKVATGGVPAEGEINGILKNLGNDASPNQIMGAAKTLLGVAAGRLTPLQEKVNDAKLENVVHVLGPDAKEILARRGFDPETMKPAAKSAGNTSYKETAIGPNGHKIGSNDGQKTWYDVQTGKKVN